MADSYSLFKCSVFKSDPNTNVVSLEVVSEDPKDAGKHFDADWSKAQQVKKEWSDPDEKPTVEGATVVVAIHDAHASANGLHNKWPLDANDGYYLFGCTVVATNSGTDIVTLKVKDGGSAGTQFDAKWTDVKQVSQPFSDSISLPAPESTTTVAVHVTHCATKGLSTSQREKRPISLPTPDVIAWKKLKLGLKPRTLILTFDSGSIDLMDPTLAHLPGTSFDDEGRIHLVLSDAAILALKLSAIESENFPV